MQLQNLKSAVQSEDMPIDGSLSTTQNLQGFLPALLAALDAAEAAGDQLRAERLIAKIYEVMDLSVRLPDQDPA